jgi:hypothetical protein
MCTYPLLTWPLPLLQALLADMRLALHAAVDKARSWTRLSTERCEALDGMATSLNELYKWVAPQWAGGGC